MRALSLAKTIGAPDYAGDPVVPASHLHAPTPAVDRNPAVGDQAAAALMGRSRTPPIVRLQAGPAGRGRALVQVRRNRIACAEVHRVSVCPRNAKTRRSTPVVISSSTWAFTCSTPASANTTGVVSEGVAPRPASTSTVTLFTGAMVSAMRHAKIRREKLSITA